MMNEQPIAQQQPPVPVAAAPIMQQPQPIRQTPPVMPTIPNQQMMPSAQIPEDETEQQKALLMKVLQLTDDQINALPPQARDQIRTLVRKKIVRLCKIMLIIHLL